MALTATAAPDVKPPGAVIGPVAARSRAPAVLWAVALLVAALLALPLVYVVVQAAQSGWSEILRLVFRRFTLELVWNTIKLSLTVTVFRTLCTTFGKIRPPPGWWRRPTSPAVGSGPWWWSCRWPSPTS